MIVVLLARAISLVLQDMQILKLPELQLQHTAASAVFLNNSIIKTNSKAYIKLFFLLLLTLTHDFMVTQ